MEVMKNMPGLTHEELARRLREARQACGLTQEAVAGELGVSRPTVAQVEAGERKVTGLELARLAQLYGRPITDFIGEAFEVSAEPILLRALPEAKTDPETAAAIREATALVSDLVSLRDLLGISTTEPGLPGYRLPRLTSRWQAIEQANRLGASERHRLGLGQAPVSNLAALLELQGALVLEMGLPAAVSGFTFRSNGTLALAVHARQSPARRRFSLAHEYCHAICDWGPGEGVAARDERAIVSRTADGAELGEVRANAFAAAFLLPEDGVRSFLGRHGKGSPTRPSGIVFTESEPRTYVVAEGRLPPHSQDIGSWEIGLIADYFMVSRECVVWRLFNLRLLTEPRRDGALAIARGEMRGQSHGYATTTLLGIEPAEDGRSRASAEPFQSARRTLAGLAVEALRREEISAGRFRELADRAGLSEADIAALIADAQDES